MKIKYGAFEFQPWEATLSDVTVRATHSVRGFRQLLNIEFHIDGEVCANGQYNVSTRLQEIGNAFTNDGYDIGLFHDDGTPTVHYLESNGALNLSGNQIFYKRFPSGEGGEYITGRKFAIGVRAITAGYDTPLVFYKDTIRRTGNGGPIAEWGENESGIFVRQLTPSSHVTFVHSGRAVNASGYMMPPAPYYAYPFHLNHLESISYIGPDRFPQAVTDYTTEWSYVYKLPADAYTIPTVR